MKGVSFKMQKKNNVEVNEIMKLRELIWVEVIKEFKHKLVTDGIELSSKAFKNIIKYQEKKLNFMKKNRNHFFIFLCFTSLTLIHVHKDAYQCDN